MITMNYRKFEMMRGDNKKDGTVTVHAENFTSVAEVAAVTRARTKVPGGQFRGHDYFGDNWYNAITGDWYGFEDQEEFLDLISNGVTDSDIVRKVAKYSGKAEVKEQDKLSRRVWDVAGGSVDVASWLAGNPTCMQRYEKKRVKSKVVNIGIETEVTCEISSSMYEKAGMILAKTVSKLEKAGYRIGIRAMTGFYAGGSNIITMSAVIKKEYSPMNYARMMMPLTKVAFDRGIGWGWAGRNPNYGNQVGTYVCRAFTGNTTAKMEEMYEKASGLKDFTVFSHKDMIKMLNESGEDGLEKYIEARIKGE